MDHSVGNDPKRAHALAKQMIQDIVAGSLGADAFLGREPVLLERYGVSRDTFREALRQLEWLGIVRTQRGARGGVYVQPPNQSAVVNVLRDYIDFSQPGFGDLLAVRRVLEQELLHAAIARLEDRDIVRLRILQGQFQRDMSREHFVMLLFRFYRQLMDIADNEVITLSLMPLLFVTVDLANFETLSDSAFADNSERAWHTLSALLDELIGGNVVAASGLLLRFLDFTGASVPDQIAALHNAESYPDWFDARRNKLARGLIYRIHQDIRRSGCQQGDHLGTEAELMARYDVSRNTFREACRVLEVVGLVTVQKGRDGGLKVAQPRPDNAISAVVYYLNAVKVSYLSLTRVRNAVELAAVPAAVSSLSDQAAERLTELLAVQKAVVGDKRFAAAAIATQKAMIRYCGNPIMIFYYDALLDSIYYRDQGAVALTRLMEHAEPITASQSVIIDAMLHRDRALARRRVLQHHAAIEKYVGSM